MRKNIFKKVTAVALSLTMVVGVSGAVSAATHAANGANVASGSRWSSFSVCTREDGGEWEDALMTMKTDKYPNGQVKGVDYATEGWITSEYGNTGLTAATVNGGFRYFITSTGWDGEYNKITGDLVADNPWGMTATLQPVSIELGRYYTISYQVKSTLKGTKPVKDANGNVMKDEAGKDITEPNTVKHVSFKAYDPKSPGEPSVAFESVSGANATTSGMIELDSTKDWQTVTATSKIPATKKQYAADTLGMKFALGANIVTYPDESGMKGDILVKDFKIVAGNQHTVTFVNGSSKSVQYVNNGEKVSAQTFTKKGYTLAGFKTASGTYNFNNPVTSDLTLEAVWAKTKAPAKPKISKAKTGKKKVTVTIKKVANAKGYEIRYSNKKSMKGAKKKTTTAAKYTIKKLKSKKYVYIKVRAYTLDSTGSKVYGKLSARKKVYVK